MNFLAHLHIAAFTGSSFTGNFLGDFVKGNPDGLFNAEIVQGIRVHRFVDSYTDQHVIVKTLKPHFPAELRRFAPISLDMFWDHCLAKHWAQFHGCPLTDFCRQARLQIEVERKLEINPLPDRFEKVSQLVWQGRWLEQYAEIDNISFALQRMASRSPRMAPLADTGEVLQVHYELLTEQFFELYPDVLQKSAQFIKTQ
ncbi:ACP phosphodiesterase [Psychromonas ossibalaenae]|uniref:acyl carrier protein phosphodiesterase n=1 Tax=Psychromonas ossibalaenae TaxID=444922 RepID=UPI00037C09FC|nr:ACP phosphodiesterase [Psychromonas ossibalaenae]